MNETVQQTAHTQPESIWLDPHVWVAISFVLFIAVFIKWILPPINKGLDERAKTIADQLAMAERLRAEAEALLAASKEQQAAIKNESAEILAQAERDVAEIYSKAEADLAQALARRTEIAEGKIARSKTNAIESLRTQMIETATETARAVLIAQLGQQKEDPTIAVALQSIERDFH